MRRTPCFLAGLLLVLPLSAGAACLDDAEALAKQYHLAAAAPSTTASSSASRPEALAESGGVITPPPTGDMASATPPVPGGDRMPTAPVIPPQTASGDTENAMTDGASHMAASDTQAAALLQAARDAARNGNETACRQRLADARTLLRSGAGK